MLLYLLDKVVPGIILLLIGLYIKYPFNYLRSWIKSPKERANDLAEIAKGREEMVKPQAETVKGREGTGNSPKESIKSRLNLRRLVGILIAALLIVCAGAVGLVIVAAQAVQQTSPWFPIVRLVEGLGVGFFLFVGLAATVGLLAFNYIIEVESRCRQLEERDELRDERLKEIEMQLPLRNRLLEDLFSGQQRLPFMSDRLM